MRGAKDDELNVFSKMFHRASCDPVLGSLILTSFSVYLDWIVYTGEEKQALV